MTLTTRLVLTNAVVVVGGFVALAATPVTVSFLPTGNELLVLTAFVAVLVAVETWVVIRALAPLRQVRDAMHRSEDPTDRLPALVARDDEIGEVAQAFTAMVQRLAQERRATARNALRAQEDERSRVARELHDEVGQDLGVLMLEASALRKSTDPATAARLDNLVERMRDLVDEVRAISARLRPGALEDLGLEGAIRALINEFHRQAEVRIRFTCEARVTLDAEQELVIYRVTQEALTNVVRHAQARQADVALTTHGETLEVTISDDGSGVDSEPGTGVVGMRERARLVHGSLSVSARPDGGTVVRLSMPLTKGRTDD